MTPAMKQAKEALESMDNMLFGEFGENWAEEYGVEYRALAEVLASLSAATEADDGWMPIEGAPKDGTFIHVTRPLNGGWTQRFVRWKSYAAWRDEPAEEGWEDVSGATRFVDSDAWTHYRPLPAPPKEKA